MLKKNSSVKIKNDGKEFDLDIKYAVAKVCDNKLEILDFNEEE